VCVRERERAREREREREKDQLPASQDPMPRHQDLLSLWLMKVRDSYIFIHMHTHIDSASQDSIQYHQDLLSLWLM